MGELNGWPGLARMALYVMRGKLGILDLSKRFGTANAGLAFYNGKLLAMSEDDMPYAISISPEDGDLHSLGRYDICGTEEQFSMTAHPKIDPVTGEMFSYSYRVVQAPYVRYWRATPLGEMCPPVTINKIEEPVLLHDFAVTENYAIIPDPMMVFRMQEMLAGRTPVVVDERKVTKFGVLPKYAADDSAIKWFETPGFSCFHYLNAWEEGDEVVLVGSNNSPPSRALVDLALLYNYFTEYRMNLKTREISMKRLSDWNIDMGRMNERFLGRKNRFAYLSLPGPWPKLAGIVKFDIEAASKGAVGEVAVRNYPPGCYGSEPFFVPRIWGADDAASEDDGYIVTFLHNEVTNVSELGIFDARSPTLEPVATVKIPVRVPYGFHGLFITEEQLANQYSSPLNPENLN